MSSSSPDGAAPARQATAPSAPATKRLLRPRSVAIVGISPETGSPGLAVLDNLERFRYAGAIHLVSRSHAEIKGRACVAAIDQLPDSVDVVLLLIPRGAVEEAVAACVRRSAGAIIVFAAGFAEAGGDWRATQDRIAAVCRDGGIALCGPNCLGIVNYVDGIPLTFSPQQPAASPGGPSIAVLAQSGGLSSILRTALQAKGLPVAYTISTGNEAVLGLEDYLDLLLDDPAVRIVTLFAEQIRRPRRFLALAARARDIGKAIVMLHPGRSAAARAAAQSHTGALAGDHAVMQALVRREGVLLADGLDELIDVSELLARFAEPPAKGPAIVTDSGAFKGMTLDVCQSLALDLPPLSPASDRALQGVLPDFVAPDNPLDLTAQGIMHLDLYARTIAPLSADPQFGSLMVAAIIGANSDFATAKLRSIVRPLVDAGMPAILALLGDEVALPPGLVDEVRAAGIALFRSPERALRALARITEYGEQAAKPRARRVAGSGAAPAPLLPGVLPEHLSKAYLAALGIAVPNGRLVHDLAAARRAASEIGYPVALKLQSAALPHKSDAGGVALALTDEASLVLAWRRMFEAVERHAPGIAIDGVLVEAMAQAGLEMIIGARHDPSWGPVIAVGLGGLWTEAMGDVRLMATDLDPAEVAAELGRLKAAPLLDGARGMPPRDIAALVDLVVRLSSLVRARPEIREIDLNPVALFARGQGALVLDALIVAE